MKKELGTRTVIAPLPVLIIATYDANGVPDAMNAAWGGQCDHHKVALNLDSRHKTTENLLANRAFTLSIGTQGTLKICDYFGLISGHKTDKIRSAGVRVEHAKCVNAPIISDFPLTMECEVEAVTEENGGTRVVARVVRTVADEEVLNAEGKVDYDRLHVITFDSETNTYRILGAAAGTAFHDGSIFVKN